MSSMVRCSGRKEMVGERKKIENCVQTQIFMLAQGLPAYFND
jgi:hypothetical protein